MKRSLIILILAAGSLAFGIIQPWKVLGQAPTFQIEEYAVIRWDGRDNTHVIRPNGKVEFLGKMLDATSRPTRADERSFYLTIAMNALAKEGYAFAGKTSDEIVMKRSVK